MLSEATEALLTEYICPKMELYWLELTSRWMHLIRTVINRTTGYIINSEGFKQAETTTLS